MTTRAVALFWDWPYDTRSKFPEVVRNAAAQTGYDRIVVPTGQAHNLREAAERHDDLDLKNVREQLRGVRGLLDRLELMMTRGQSLDKLVDQEP